MLHIPVLLNEVLENLNIKDLGIYIDGTFGNGGYTEAILKKFKNTKVIAFDRDKNVLNKVDEFKKKYQDRFIFFQDCFSNILQNIKNNNIEKVDGLVLDIGVSSMQIDTPERGFSFRFDAPLSMTMGNNKIDAKDVINTFSEKMLSDIFYKYGEEPRSKFLAKKIINTREKNPILTTFQLVNLIEDTFGKSQSTKIIPRIFQSIRIFVNEELDELNKILNDSKDILKPQGRLVVVDFHSLEDRIVKTFIKENTESKISGSRYLPDNKQSMSKKIYFKKIHKNVIIPSDDELKNNYRSRSAKLRVIERI